MRSADSLFSALMLDVWPNSPAALFDFGLNGKNASERYSALQYAVKYNNVSADDLHKAVLENKVDELVSVYGNWK